MNVVRIILGMIFLSCSVSIGMAEEKASKKMTVKERLKAAQEEEFNNQHEQPKERITSLDETYRDRYNRLHKQSEAMKEKRLLKQEERLEKMDDRERAMYDKRQKLRKFINTTSK